MPAEIHESAPSAGPWQRSRNASGVLAENLSASGFIFYLMKAYPEWLHVIAWLYLALCSLIALWIVSDFLRGNRQKMWVMHLVWPITAMYFGPVAAWLYLRTRPISLATSPKPDEQTKQHMKKMEPTREQVSV